MCLLTSLLDEKRIETIPHPLPRFCICPTPHSRRRDSRRQQTTFSLNDEGIYRPSMGKESKPDTKMIERRCVLGESLARRSRKEVPRFDDARRQ